MDQRGVGQTAVAATGRRRQTLWDQMSAVDTGSGNAAVLGEADKRQPQLAVTPTPAQVNRTLLDIIRDEEPHGGSLFGHSNKMTWKAFRERIRIRRAGSAWTSSIHVPTSDIPICNANNGHLNQHSSSGGSSSGGSSSGVGHRHHQLMSNKNSVSFTTVLTLNTGETTHLDDLQDGYPPAPETVSSSASRPTMIRFAVDGGSEPDDGAPPVRSFRPQMSRHNSTRFPGDGIGDIPLKLSVVLAEERAMTAREAVAAEEEAEAEEEDDNEGESPGGDGPVRMSLMDLLEETNQRMGLEGARYTVGDDVVEAEDHDEKGPDTVEHTCCVCMVRHRGSAFIPCGHTFCRLCSRELWVQRGNCPLCNGFILEILDIF